MLVSSIVRRNAVFAGDADAIVEPGRRTLSWSALDERTNRLARGLLDLGLAKGDRIGVLAPNCGEHVELFFAEAKSGVVGAPMNVRLTPDEWASYCRYTEPGALVVHASLASAGQTLAEQVPAVRHVIGFGGEHDLPIDLDQLAAAHPPTEPAVEIDERDLYQLAATSGTTGVSKAAALTHRNAWAAICMYLAELEIHERETVLQNIPLYFNPGGPAHLHPALVKGGRTVILPGFDPAVFCDAVARYGVQHTILVPTMVTMVLEHPAAAGADFSSLRTVISGGSPVSRDLVLRARAAFGDVLVPQYGMAESYSSGLILRREHQIVDGPEDVVRRLGSAGTPHVSIEVRLVGVDGRDVARDGIEEGEIWLRGDSVADEYFRMPEETAASRDGDWFKTGDLGVMDSAGFVTVVDRAKDVIITGGINVHGREVEEVLLRHPAVAAAAVVGLPHPTWGEQVHAVVVARPGMAIDERELLAECAAHLAGYKKPHGVTVVDELPMTATGKVRKRELRDRLRAG
jgi:acyl-CoA synthetase (AMP-forming)/AMP-acid ligase II